jgi:hypothetical protein
VLHQLRIGMHSAVSSSLWLLDSPARRALRGFERTPIISLASSSGATYIGRLVAEFWESADGKTMCAAYTVDMAGDVQTTERHAVPASEVAEWVAALGVATRGTGGLITEATLTSCPSEVSPERRCGPCVGSAG